MRYWLSVTSPFTCPVDFGTSSLKFAMDTVNSYVHHMLFPAKGDFRIPPSLIKVVVSVHCPGDDIYLPLFSNRDAWCTMDEDHDPLTPEEQAVLDYWNSK